MGVVGETGVLQTDLDNLQILHWENGKRKGAPRVIRVKAKRGVGWGGHLGFAEMHPAFIKAVRTNQAPFLRGQHDRRHVAGHSWRNPSVNEKRLQSNEQTSNQ